MQVVIVGLTWETSSGEIKKNLLENVSLWLVEFELYEKRLLCVFNVLTMSTAKWYSVIPCVRIEEVISTYYYEKLMIEMHYTRHIIEFMVKVRMNWYSQRYKHCKIGIIDKKLSRTCWRGLYTWRNIFISLKTNSTSIWRWHRYRCWRVTMKWFDVWMYT